MAKKKKGPRQAAGLKCTVCGNFNYITEFNKNNEQLKKQTTGESTFPLKKYCNKVCKKRTKHVLAKKLK
ncbi:MAG: 50S ribosomal protein L33 [Candidatus Woesebacteria bacterium]|jgi:ribosomal protein L33